MSTLGQVESGAGLDAQLTTLTAEATRRGCEFEVLTDAGWSAKTLERPALAEAVARLDSGDADVLVVAKLDWLPRSTLGFCTLLGRAQRRGWSVVCLDLGVDTSTPTGELLSLIVAAIAAYERRLIGLRTRAGMAARRAAGVHTGPAQHPARTRPDPDRRRRHRGGVLRPDRRCAQRRRGLDRAGRCSLVPGHRPRRPPLPRRSPPGRPAGT